MAQVKTVRAEEHSRDAEVAADRVDLEVAVDRLARLPAGPAAVAARVAVLEDLAADGVSAVAQAADAAGGQAPLPEGEPVWPPSETRAVIRACAITPTSG